MTRVLLLFILASTAFCNRGVPTHSDISARDSIMNKYFELVDSFVYCDTLNRGFKLLKAYHSNDIDYLNESNNELYELLKYRKEHPNPRVCEEPLAMPVSGYYEAYRFIYVQAFCDKSVNLTIGRRGDSVISDLYLYQTSNRGTECKTVSHIRKQLNIEVWYNMATDLRHADFWGLREDNGNNGVDGSSLVVEGYERPVNAFKGRFKSIYRWAGEEQAIGILFKKMLDLSGTKVDCFYFR